MARPKLSKLELQILEALWAHGKASIREIQEAFPEPRPAYTTIQTTVYRLEGKNAVRRVRKIGNAHIFEPMVARDVARRRLLDEILSFFGGRAQPKLSRLELQILEALWAHGKASIREIQEAFPEPRPAYTTIQTTVYRLEGKNAVRRVRKISNAHIFEPILARDVTRHRLLDEILSFFGGRAQPMMAQLAEAGKLTLDDVRELEKTIKKLDLQQKAESTRKSK
jgi:predicted transcriptional regulator